MSGEATFAMVTWRNALLNVNIEWYDQYMSLEKLRRLARCIVNAMKFTVGQRHHTPLFLPILAIPEKVRGSVT